MIFCYGKMISYKIENFIGFTEGDIEDLVSTNVLIQVTSGKF